MKWQTACWIFCEKKKERTQHEGWISKSLKKGTDVFSWESRRLFNRGLFGGSVPAAGLEDPNSSSLILRAESEFSKPGEPVRVQPPQALRSQSIRARRELKRTSRVSFYCIPVSNGSREAPRVLSRPLLLFLFALVLRIFVRVGVAHRIQAE